MSTLFTRIGGRPGRVSFWHKPGMFARIIGWLGAWPAHPASTGRNAAIADKRAEVAANAGRFMEHVRR